MNSFCPVWCLRQLQFSPPGIDVCCYLRQHFCEEILIFQALNDSIWMQLFGENEHLFVRRVISDENANKWKANKSKQTNKNTHTLQCGCIFLISVDALHHQSDDGSVGDLCREEPSSGPDAARPDHAVRGDEPHVAPLGTHLHHQQGRQRPACASVQPVRQIRSQALLDGEAFI